MGVQRQYSGTAGRIENSQVGVFLTYATAQGRVLLDRELYLPQVWAEDGERRREAGVPEAATFRTKPQLAQDMLERAVESGVPFSWVTGSWVTGSWVTGSWVTGSWVTGDAVYGAARNLRLWRLWRLWLEQREYPTCWPSRVTRSCGPRTDKGPRQVRADQLVSGVAESDWSRCSAGNGAKGPRVYDWVRVVIRPLREPGKGYWLLARRSIAQPGELAYYLCFGPVDTTLEELVRVAGTRWAIQECFEEAKGQVGLDQYEVRKWEGWYRHITLAMLAHAYLAVIRKPAQETGG